jgi:hypothetical protein
VFSIDDACMWNPNTGKAHATEHLPKEEKKEHDAALIRITSAMLFR